MKQLNATIKIKLFELVQFCNYSDKIKAWKETLLFTFFTVHKKRFHKGKKLIFQKYTCMSFLFSLFPGSQYCSWITIAGGLPWCLSNFVCMCVTVHVLNDSSIPQETLWFETSSWGMQGNTHAPCKRRWTAFPSLLTWLSEVTLIFPFFVHYEYFSSKSLLTTYLTLPMFKVSEQLNHLLFICCWDEAVC